MPRPVAKFIVPDGGDKVDSGVGLSHRPTRLHRLAGRYENLMARVNYIPQSVTENLDTAVGMVHLCRTYSCTVYHCSYSFLW